MPESKENLLVKSLRYFQINCPSVFGSAVISLEGFTMASVSPKGLDDELIGGMSAALLGVGERIAKEIMDSNLKRVFVQSEKGYILINSIDNDSMLISLIDNDAKLGLVFLELRRLIPKLKTIIA